MLYLANLVGRQGATHGHHSPAPHIHRGQSPELSGPHRPNHRKPPPHHVGHGRSPLDARVPGPTRQAVQLLLHPLPDGQLPWTTNLEVADGTAFVAVVNVLLTCAMLKTWGFSLTNAGILPRRDRREWFWIPAACLIACGANLIKSVMTDRALAWFPEHTHLYRSQATTDEALPSFPGPSTGNASWQQCTAAPRRPSTGPGRRPRSPTRQCGRGSFMPRRAQPRNAPARFRAPEASRATSAPTFTKSAPAAR